MPHSDYLDYILQDVLADEPGLSSRFMFGGFAIYKNGVIVGMVIDEMLYFKVDETNKAQYEKLGSKPFMYTARGKTIPMSYWTVPDSIIENRTEIKKWLETSYQISLKKKKK
jgi:DNA transformation protein